MSTYPPHRTVFAREARSADAEATERFGIPSIVLLEHAGRGLAEIVASRAPAGGAVAVLCGPGNNGGDGYAAARFLHSWGVPVRVVRCASQAPSAGDAALEHAALERSRPIAAARGLEDAPIVTCALADAAVVVDALFGTGGRPLEEPYLAWVDAVARARDAGAVVVAVDLPSGLDADVGRPMPRAVVADVTAAMGFVKRGCVSAVGAPYCGRLVEVDVGLPREVHERFLAPPGGGPRSIGS